jgi:uncharacterized protein
MKAYLLDVNVLIALAWPSHLLHDRVIRWFDKHAARGWATCPLTEAGFVRVLSNPAFSPRSIAPEHALELLKMNAAHETHQFWTADISLGEALRLSHVRIMGHQQISDAYLLGLAAHKGGILATCDEAIHKWGSAARADRYFVEVIR